MMLLWIVIPEQHFYSRILCRHEVDTLFTTLSFLHQKAIASNTVQELLFTSTANTYHDRATHHLALPVNFGFLPGTLGPPSSPSRIIKKAITFRNSRIRFLPTGTMTPGTVYIIDQKRQSMYALTTPVSAVSFIRMYRYDGGKWITV